ncbi:MULTISPECIES: hypothetical protein [Streptomyces]|uniref:Uncharacterized protein n=1 Tax=Streptomyces xanthii TaxID=2768069 RepID=A0A7H1B6A6_9ACTN|nr:hypothetical protein [Streptomyces xanthii]QNS04261.1 hypothetical protein IAG42_11930 [Streptomyces xanthii]
MTVDPSDPETFTERGDNTEIDVEAPEADAAEQHADLSQDRDDPPAGDADPDTANEADRAEQARVVALDEDDYR